jgi:hypothetical protein
LATKDLWERLHTVVSRMSERLSDKDKKFHDTLVGNISDLCCLLSKLNLTGDADLEAMRHKIEAKLTFQDADTLLARIRGVHNLTTSEEYVRMIAISRIFLPNITNIQASWLTVGKNVAQMCLHAGANDFGSIMLEENVVSAAGAPHRFTYKSIQDAISEAGFEPQLRNQRYEWRKLPEMIEEQVIDY